MSMLSLVVMLFITRKIPKTWKCTKSKVKNRDIPGVSSEPSLQTWTLETFTPLWFSLQKSGTGNNHSDDATKRTRTFPQDPEKPGVDQGTQNDEKHQDQSEPGGRQVSVWQCAYCNMIFNYKSTYIRHCRRHLGDYKYHCEVCQKGFMEKRELGGHMAMKHGAPKTYQCDLCGASFSYKRSLKDHLLKCHNITQ